MHEGYPLVTLPGANVFYTDEDLTTPDGVIRCKQISTAQLIYDATKVGRWLDKLAEGL